MILYSQCYISGLTQDCGNSIVNALIPVVTACHCKVGWLLCGTANTYPGNPITSNQFGPLVGRKLDQNIKSCEVQDGKLDRWHQWGSGLCVVPERWIKKFNRGMECREHSEFGRSQWETTLHCNVVSHWLCPYSEWSVEWDVGLGCRTEIRGPFHEQFFHPFMMCDTSWHWFWVCVSVHKFVCVLCVCVC